MKTKSFIAALLLLFCATSLWASDTSVDGIWYNFNSSTMTASVTYKGSDYDSYSNEYSGTIVIPSSVTYGGGTYSVTSIGESAFAWCSGLTSVTIPNSVTSIGESAFAWCSGLTSVTIPNSVTSIGKSAFYNCTGLTSVTIPNSVTSIGGSAFAYCSGLTSVTIPESITSIGGSAFYDCSGLTSVTIPNSVTSIGSSAFSGCSGLTSVTIPNSVTSIEGRTFANCSGLTSVTIPESVTSIGRSAFSGCSGLTSVTIPNSVTSIGSYAFYGCSGLTSVTIPNSVTSIEDYAFEGCSGLTSVTIPESVTSIGSCAFSGCSGLTSVVVENGNTVYDSRDNCNAIIVTSTNTLKTGCKNTIIPNSVTSIGGWAFSGCSGLTSVTIPNSVTSIGGGAFRYCSSLTSVTIPNSVTSIGSSAFYNCSCLTSVTWNSRNCSSPSNYSSAPFYDICSQITSLVFGDDVEVIPAYLCFGMDKLTSVTIPTSVTSIGNGAFSYCFGLTSVAIPNNVTTIRNETFSYCTNLKSVIIGENVTNISTSAFSSTGLTSIIWNAKNCNSASTYSSSPFYQNCEEITSFVFGSEVESIPAYLCNGMNQLTSIAIPNSVTAIGDYAFAGLNNRKFNTLVLPNTIKKIGAHAFDGAAYLQTIHFGSVLEEIGEYAFNGCTRVRKMTCLAEITPNVGTDGLTSISDLAELYVPDDYLFDYQLDNNWNRFQLKALGATETTVTSNDVTIVTDDNTATFTWPTNNTADSYTIEITKDGVVFCQLIFNANGQLTGIAFAPSRDGQASAPAATMTAAGMQFTVTGLNSGTSYGYTLEAKSGTTTVASYSGSFATAGGIITNVNEVNESSFSHKVSRDGQVLILRDGKTYNLQGQEVK